MKMVIHNAEETAQMKKWVELCNPDEATRHDLMYRIDRYERRRDHGVLAAQDMNDMLQLMADILCLLMKR